MLKEDVKKVIDNMPNDCTLEDIQYSLYVRSKIDKGLKDVENGDLISQEDVERGMKKWLKR